MATFCNIYGQVLYKIEGEFIKDFYGRTLYVYRNNQISRFAGLPEYKIRDSATEREVAILILLCVPK